MNAADTSPDSDAPDRSLKRRFSVVVAVVIVLLSLGELAGQVDLYDGALAEKRIRLVVRQLDTSRRIADHSQSYGDLLDTWDADHRALLAAEAADRSRGDDAQARLNTLMGLSDVVASAREAAGAGQIAGVQVQAKQYAETLSPIATGYAAGLSTDTDRIRYTSAAMWLVALLGLGAVGMWVLGPLMVLAQTRREEADYHRKRLRHVIDAVADPIYIADAQGRIVLRNRARTLLDERLASLGAGQADGGMQADRMAIESARPSTDRGLLPGGAGWLLTVRTPLSAGDGIVVLARDVTREHVADAELRSCRQSVEVASRVKGEFMDGVSHELRTPLNGIVGMTELLLQTRLDSEQRELAQTIQSSSRTLSALVSNLLDFADIRAEHIDLAENTFEVRSCVEAALSAATAQASANGVHLRYLILSGVPRAVKGDELRILQVLGNLLSNAAKFTKDGAAFLRIGATPDPSGPEGAIRLRFTIKDTGIGIAQEDLGSIFGSFAQADGSTTRAHTGAGLGLTIARQLVAMMGGEIGVESTPGDGATFWFVVPVQAASLTSEQQRRIEEARPNVAGLHVTSSTGDSATAALSQALASGRESVVTLPPRQSFSERGELKSGRFAFARSVNTDDPISTELASV